MKDRKLRPHIRGGSVTLPWKEALVWGDELDLLREVNQKEKQILYINIYIGSRKILLINLHRDSPMEIENKHVNTVKWESNWNSKKQRHSLVRRDSDCALGSTWKETPPVQVGVAHTLLERHRGLPLIQGAWNTPSQEEQILGGRGVSEERGHTETLTENLNLNHTRTLYNSTKQAMPTNPNGQSARGSGKNVQKTVCLER